MRFNAKLTGALAWAGLAVIIAVPSADLLFGNPKTRAALTSDMRGVEPAPAGKPVLGTDSLTTASIGDPVDTYLDKNKQLPSYISDGAPPAQPVAVKPAVPVVAPAEPAVVASVPPVPETPPVPMPRSMRPRTEVASVPVITTPQPLPEAEPVAAAQPEPLIVDETDLARREAALADESAADQPVIEGDRLEEWDSGSLADYLERKNLITDGAAEPQPQAADDGRYDPNGFYLDEGPNRQRRLLRDEPQDFFLF